MIRLWKGLPRRPFPLKLPALRLFLIVWLPFLAAACHRQSAPPAAHPPVPSPVPGEHAAVTPVATATPAAAATPALPDFAVDAADSREGVSSWYDVPVQSLAERRAWPGEMTAASDTLPLNTYVRVRRVGSENNGRSVVVRITDNGVHRKGVLIELDRRAAETLDMVARGEVRVRVETLALKHADADKSVAKKDAVPTASKITATPAASREQEKDAAAAKAGGATP